MDEPSSLNSKVNQIRKSFSSVVGSRLARYETAELLHDDGIWAAWPDLPIRLYLGTTLIAISWSNFDNLWIASDSSLPFSIEGSTVRWVGNSIEKINPAIGAMLRSVLIGRGEMSIEGNDVEIWTRLLIQVDDGWLEIFNALDENGYAFHNDMPAGNFVSCCDYCGVNAMTINI